MKIGVADRNIVAKIYCRCLSTFLILNLLHYYLVDLVRPGSSDFVQQKCICETFRCKITCSNKTSIVIIYWCYYAVYWSPISKSRLYFWSWEIKDSFFFFFKWYFKIKNARLVYVSQSSIFGEPYGTIGQCLSFQS